MPVGVEANLTNGMNGVEKGLHQSVGVIAGKPHPLLVPSGLGIGTVTMTNSRKKTARLDGDLAARFGPEDSAATSVGNHLIFWQYAARSLLQRKTFGMFDCGQ